ncbi:MAG: PEGA domain-containing protein [Methanoregula sp.]|nr:PEGA domain-containing protein [Methanoregula sp.]
MKKQFFLVGLVIFLLLVPVVSALGGDQGWIEIRCNVDGARVYFDGAEKGVISGGSLTVPVYSTADPNHSFSVEKAGYTPYSGEVTSPSAGETKTVYATLNPVETPVPVNYGSLYVESSPSGAAIYFNGNYRGSAPVTISEIWPGSYTIQAELNGYRTYTTTTSVSSGSRSNVYCPLSPTDTSGSLYILSDPTNAKVVLDGVVRGTTPLTLNKLASGTHIVELDRAGYYDWKSTVDVPNGGTKTVSASLNPMPVSTTGWVYVSSSPGGASVILDGTNYGQTPGSGSLKLNSIGIGEHTVTLTLAGYQTYTTRVTVYANTVSEVSGLLQPTGPKAGVGEVSVSSTPAGANVMIDNNFVGITPLTLKDISAGSHVITIELTGYQDYEVTTAVNAGATSTVVAGLSPATPTTPQRSGSLPFIAFGAVLVLALFSLKKNQ